MIRAPERHIVTVVRIALTLRSEMPLIGICGGGRAGGRGAKEMFGSNFQVGLVGAAAVQNALVPIRQSLWLPYPRTDHRLYVRAEPATSSTSDNRKVKWFH